jgi:hypothetical protein
MKKIFALCLTFMLILSLCACAQQETIDGRKYEVLNGNFMIIEAYEHGAYLVATKDTGVMYVLEANGNRGFLSPYLIYEDGAIYGAAWVDGKITPIPFATE